MSSPVSSLSYDILRALGVPTLEELLGNDSEGGESAQDESVQERVDSAALSVLQGEREIDPGEEADDERSDWSSESSYISSGEDARISGVEVDVEDSSDDETQIIKTLYRASFDEASALQDKSE